MRFGGIRLERLIGVIGAIGFEGLVWRDFCGGIFVEGSGRTVTSSVLFCRTGFQKLCSFLRCLTPDLCYATPDITTQPPNAAQKTPFPVSTKKKPLSVRKKKKTPLCFAHDNIPY